MLKNKKVKYCHRVLLSLSVALLATVLTFIPLVSISAQSIDELNSQAQNLQNEIKENENKINNLAQRAGSLEEKLNQLRAQVTEITQQINTTTKRIDELSVELDKTQAELERQKDILRRNLRVLYKQGNISTVQLLASTDNYSDFVNEQEYLERLKLGVQESADKVDQLKKEIEGKKKEQEKLREQQEAQRELVQKNQDEQASLLAQTRGEEARYKQINDELYNQQAAVLAEIVARSRVISGVGTGNYPWADYRAGSWTHWESCTYGDDIDPWNYCFRQCTSFVAWRLYAAGKNSPVGYGNANNWGYMAAANGIPTGSTPQVGAVAVWGGAEGHVAFVEEVYGNGQVRISEYNAVPALQGFYSERIISAGDPYVYIYF